MPRSFFISFILNLFLLVRRPESHIFFLHIFSFSFVISYTCWGSVPGFGLFGVIIGRGGDKEKVLFECLFASLFWGLTFFIFWARELLGVEWEG